jgi:hypothetical protein
MSNRRAFTLIEILISIGLGLIIIGTVYAGFRVSTQAMIVCNRLSIENRLLTAGFARSLQEVDFWGNFDRPGFTPCRTVPTKAIDGVNGGYDGSGGDATQLPQPFTAFSRSWKDGLSDNAGSALYDQVWLPHDPKTWYRGDGQSGAYGWADDSVWGDYGLFSCAESSVEHRGEVTPVGIDGGSDLHTWYARQQKGLKYALGFYGWWDYLPANAIINWYEGPRPIAPFEMRSRYGIPQVSAPPGGLPVPPPMIPVSEVGRFPWWMGGAFSSHNDRPVTRASFLWEQGLGICAPRPAIGANPADDANEALRLNRWVHGSRWLHWEWQTPWNLIGMNLSRPQPLLVNRPRAWPKVTWDVRRYKMFSRTVNECFVRVFDPLTGKMVEINFRTTGTTLRGARLQRVDSGKTLDDR